MHTTARVATTSRRVLEYSSMHIMHTLEYSTTVCIIIILLLSRRVYMHTPSSMHSTNVVEAHYTHVCIQSKYVLARSGTHVSTPRNFDFFFML